MIENGRCINNVVLKKFHKANEQQKIEMVRTLRKEITNLKELLLAMEKEMNDCRY